jgi:hypothetical protein
LSEDVLEEKALALIKTRPNGVLQSDLWKDLDIDSRKCSRVIARLEEEGKIKRTWETVKGTRTYRISYLPQKKETPKKEVNFELILAGEEVAPCIGCTYECEPDYCPDLGEWIELLARSPVKETPYKAVKAPEVKVIIIEEPEEVVVVAPKPKTVVKPLKAPIKEVPKKAAPKKEAPKKEAPKKEEKKAKVEPKKAAVPAKPAAPVKKAAAKPSKEPVKEPVKEKKPVKKGKK